MSQYTVASGLQEQLDAWIARAMEKNPDVVTPFLADIEALVSAGIAKQSLHEGERAPDFTLPDALGQQVTLSTLLKQGPVAAAFYRGAWCPFCNLTVRAYQKIVPQINALGATLVAISPQMPDHTLSLVEKAGLTYTVLSDAGNATARQYRLVFSPSEALHPLFLSLGSDIPAFNGDDTWELPIPGTFLIDQSGIVRLAWVDADYTHRLEPIMLLEHLQTLVEHKEV